MYILIPVFLEFNSLKCKNVPYIFWEMISMTIIRIGTRKPGILRRQGQEKLHRLPCKLAEWLHLISFFFFCKFCFSSNMFCWFFFSTFVTKRIIKYILKNLLLIILNCLIYEKVNMHLTLFRTEILPRSKLTFLHVSEVLYLRPKPFK